MYANQLHNQTNKTPTFGPSAYLRAKFAVQFRDICVNSCLTRSHTKSREKKFFELILRQYIHTFIYLYRLHTQLKACVHQCGGSLFSSFVLGTVHPLGSSIHALKTMKGQHCKRSR